MINDMAVWQKNGESTRIERSEKVLLEGDIYKLRPKEWGVKQAAEEP